MKIDELIEINKNNELKEILKLVKEDVVFLGENKRLLSKGEIENYKEELAITIDIIPLIDIGDNIFIVYDNSDEKFKKCNTIIARKGLFWWYLATMQGAMDKN